MTNSSVSLDKWRDYFRTPNSDIFDIINHAIMVAATDYPYEFRLKRDQIAEMLFTCKKNKCHGCERIENAVEQSDDKFQSGIEAGGSKDTNVSKINGCREIVVETNSNQVGNFRNYEDAAEALTCEMEEQTKFLDEVSRIKEILDNSEIESDIVLYESLRKLELMAVSVDILKETDIGKSVNALRNHGSKDIRNLVRTLIADWKAMVHEWCTIAGGEVMTESEKMPIVEEEEGLPSPPMDGFFFASPNSMELSHFFEGMNDANFFEGLDDPKFFDFMDGNGNIQESMKFSKNRVNSRKPNLEKKECDSSARPKNAITEQKRNQSKQTHQLKRNTHPSCESVLRRPIKPLVQPKVNNEISAQQKPVKDFIQKKPMKPQRELDCHNEASIHKKFEVAKRKLQERYQEAANAKKQRTIQMVEFNDLAKQKNRNTVKSGNHNRNLANGRR